MNDNEAPRQTDERQKQTRKDRAKPRGDAPSEQICHSREERRICEQHTSRHEQRRPENTENCCVNVVRTRSIEREKIAVGDFPAQDANCTLENDAFVNFAGTKGKGRPNRSEEHTYEL